MLISTSIACIWVSLWHSQNKHRLRGEIVISNDSDFKRKFKLPGSGTESDPFRLENLIINTIKDFGVRITDTKSYFIIRNCTIIAANTAISIYNVEFGTALIYNNTVVGIVGILGSDSHGLSIMNNFCRNAITGIGIIDCNNVTIENNYCIDLTYGIYINGNVSNSIIQNNYVARNREIGIYVYYWNEYSLYFSHNKNNLIKNNTCILNKVGISIDAYLEIPFLEISTYTIELNNCSFNEYVGIVIKGYYLQVANNLCSFNDAGIGSFALYNSSIQSNHLHNNTSFGIRLKSSSGSMLYHNSFFDNNVDGPVLMNAQAFDDSTVESYYGQNFWYNSFISEGNFWSDLAWILGITYDISGSNNTDLFPLQNSTI